MLKKFLVRFRHIESYDYNTPLMHIPIQSTILKAMPEEDIKTNFCKLLEWSTNPDNIRIISIEELSETGLS